MISVSVHLDESMADKELRLQEAVTEAVEQNDEVNEEYQKATEKMENLKKMLRPGVVMTDEKMIDLVKDIDGLKAEMEKNQDAMKGTQSAFMGAHSLMLEVIVSAGQVKLTDERFSRKGPWEVKLCFVQWSLMAMNCKESIF